MRRRRKPGRVHHDRWLISYADFITLLFAFFVVLFASAQADKKKQALIAGAIAHAFGRSIVQQPGGPAPTSPIAQSADEMTRAEAQLRTAAAHEIGAGLVEIRETNGGLTISLQDAGFFDSGSADVRTQALPVLDRIAAALPAMRLRVEGHTDNVPISTAYFASNWELSSARASSIARLLLRYPSVHADPTLRRRLRREPAAAGRHPGRRRPRAPARRRGLRQNPRHHASHRVSHPGAQASPSRQHPRRHLHQQGRQRNGRARRQDPRPQHTRQTHARHLPQLLRPRPAPRYRSPAGQRRKGLTRTFAIYDETDQQAVVKTALKRLGIDDKQLKPRVALGRISWAKNHMIDPQEYFLASTNPMEEKIAHIFEIYRKELFKANALDFDDLLLETVRLLKSASRSPRARYNRRFQYVMIDEYQDTNKPQYELMKLLAGTANVCVVGDEDQSIYSWRGADIKNILDFEKDFPEARTIRLEQNYRSTQMILEGASAVVAQNTQRKGKNLWTAREGGSLIGLYEAPDGENEALFIADRIQQAISAQPSRLKPTSPHAAPSSTAPTRNHASSKKPCAAIRSSTTWSAASASTTAPKSRTSSAT